MTPFSSLQCLQKNSFKDILLSLNLRVDLSSGLIHFFEKAASHIQLQSVSGRWIQTFISTLRNVGSAVTTELGSFERSYFDDSTLICFFFQPFCLQSFWFLLEILEKCVCNKLPGGLRPVDSSYRPAPCCATPRHALFGCPSRPHVEKKINPESLSFLKVKFFFFILHKWGETERRKCEWLKEK